MERRSEPRIPANEAVKVSLLGEDERLASYHGHVVEFSGRGLRLALHRPIPVNAAVSVESADCLYLGEVVFCSSADDAWHVGMIVNERLRDTLDLIRLRRGMGPSRAIVPQPVRQVGDS